MHPRIGTQLVLLTGYLYALSHLLASPRDVLALTALALAVVAVQWLAYRPAAVITGGPLTSRAAALREKSWSAAFQRQRDPDAAGRPRPRAPGRAPAARVALA